MFFIDKIVCLFDGFLLSSELWFIGGLSFFMTETTDIFCVLLLTIVFSL